MPRPLPAARDGPCAWRGSWTQQSVIPRVLSIARADEAEFSRLNARRASSERGVVLARVREERLEDPPVHRLGNPRPRLGLVRDRPGEATRTIWGRLNEVVLGETAEQGSARVDHVERLAPPFLPAEVVLVDRVGALERLGRARRADAERTRRGPGDLVEDPAPAERGVGSQVRPHLGRRPRDLERTNELRRR